MIKERTLRHLKQERILHPRDTMKMTWDATLGLIIIYSICTVPMAAGFLDAFAATASYVNIEKFDYCIDCLFFIDIILNFNTAYYDEQVRRPSQSISPTRIVFLHFFFLTCTVPARPRFCHASARRT